MRIQLERAADYAAVNRRFNNNVAALVERIFQAERVGPTGYIQTQPISMNDYLDRLHLRRYKPFEVSEHPRPAELPDVDLGQMGPSERLLITHLAYGAKTTYLYVGPIGSGKTATSNFVLANLTHLVCQKDCNQCGLKEPVIFEVNFNSGFPRLASSQQLLDEFYQTVYQQLHMQLADRFDPSYHFKDLFDKHIDRNRTLIRSHLYGFIQEVVQTPEWTQLIAGERKTRLFNWINLPSRSIPERVKLLHMLASHISRLERLRNSCFLIFYDNLDYAEPDVQIDLLDAILRLHETSRVRALVPMRISTYKRLQPAGQFVFGRLMHHGPDPWYLCARRMDHFLQNSQDSQYIDSGVLATTDDLTMLRARMAFIRSQDKHTRAMRFLTAIAGGSIRCALELCRRIFVNSQIPCQPAAPIGNNAIIRAVLDWGDEGPTFDPTDDWVANILQSPLTRKWSWLCIRVLMLLRSHQRRGRECHIALLIQELQAMRQWRVDEIASAISYLMSPLRPLIEVEGCDEYRSARELVSSRDDILRLTAIGQGYLEVALFEPTYLQYCTLSTEWPSAAALPEKVDTTQIQERFMILRLSLMIMAEEDREEYMSLSVGLRNWHRSDEHKLILVSSQMAARCASAFKFIKDKGRWELDVEQECLNWLSAVVELFNKERELTTFANRELLDAEQILRSLLNRPIPR